ncbi:hypothetical protein B7P43_G14599 [Cryptotermes secundus]|uniref:Uncharacterized protein n=1 Tax=Cryptotermes secundus TaxID=105785 RepID=A0A2J7RBC7_9NEOP|nr:hypothetical protein B7P43_G14599 [Cryptotermes secundus]
MKGFYVLLGNMATFCKILKYNDFNVVSLSNFRYLSHEFHGKRPGKNEVEKRMKKNEQEGLMKQMSSTDTHLDHVASCSRNRKKQSPFVVLSGSKQTWVSM